MTQFILLQVNSIWTEKIVATEWEVMSFELRILIRRLLLRNLGASINRRWRQASAGRYQLSGTQ